MTLQTKVYNYTGASTTFVVPADVLSVRFELWGAGAGNNHGYGVHTGFIDTKMIGGGPLTTGDQITGAGYIAGTIAVTPGEVFYLYVGGNGYNGDDDDQGSSGTITRKGGLGGWNGGGKGGTAVYNQAVDSKSQEAAAGGGGGGATDVRTGGTALANRIIVAGGAGASGSDYFGKYAYYGSSGNFGVTWGANPTTPTPPYSASPQTYYPSGGNGTGGWGGTSAARAGGNAASDSGGTLSSSGGKGGSTTGGGAGGSAGGAVGVAGGAGTLGVGGAGASGTQSTSNQAGSMAGGGGGGGYYGGGGGALGYYGYSNPNNVSQFGGGGGGGSNYANSSFTSVINEGHTYPPAAAGATGNGGFIRITYTQPPDPPNVSSPANFSSVAIDQPLTVAWSFSSPDASATAASADIEWKVSTGNTWNLTHVTMSGKTGTYTYPANFFTAGVTYNIQVRTYDNNGDVSAWSQVTVTVVTVPATPNITSPVEGGQVTNDIFSLTWTNPSGSPELLYEVSIANSHGFTLFDSGVVNAATRLNLAQNPSFETGVANWTVVGGTIATSTTYKAIGAQSGKVTWNAASPAYAYQPIPTQPGQEYEVTVAVALGTYGADPQITLGAQNPTDTAPFTSGAQSQMSVAGGFYTVSLSFVAQQSTTWVVLTPGNGTTTAGQVTYIDTMLAEINATGNPLPYFDGSNANGNAGTVGWQGTVGNSFSTLTAADVLTYSVNWPSFSQPVVATVRYATLASQGIFSDPGVRDFTINVTPPGVPTVALTTDNTAGTVSLAITAVDTPAATTYFDVFRTDVTHGEAEIRIATNVVPDPTTRKITFVDPSAGFYTLYQYRVRAYSAGLGYADAT